MTQRWRGWSTAALAAVFATLVPLATFLVSVWLLGWQLQHVESGSMSPTYPVGSLLVTHRVVGITPGAELAFLTRGDANVTNDPSPIPARLVRGRVLWHVTLLGTVLDWLQFPRSFVALVIVPAALLVVLDWRARSARLRTDSAAPA
jgi:signal peptidase I